MEKFYCGLAMNMSYVWQVFQSSPEKAPAEKSEYIAVGIGHDTAEEAHEECRLLNHMFGK